MIALLPLLLLQVLSFDLAHVSVKDDSNVFAPLGPSSHGPPVAGTSGPRAAHDLCAVLGLDAAVRKPLVASTGADNSGRSFHTPIECREGREILLYPHRRI